MFSSSLGPRVFALFLLFLFASFESVELSWPLTARLFIGVLHSNSLSSASLSFCVVVQKTKFCVAKWLFKREEKHSFNR